MQTHSPVALTDHAWVRNNAGACVPCPAGTQFENGGCVVTPPPQPLPPPNSNPDTGPGGGGGGGGDSTCQVAEGMARCEQTCQQQYETCTEKARQKSDECIAEAKSIADEKYKAGWTIDSQRFTPYTEKKKRCIRWEWVHLGPGLPAPCLDVPPGSCQNTPDMHKVCAQYEEYEVPAIPPPGPYDVWLHYKRVVSEWLHGINGVEKTFSVPFFGITITGPVKEGLLG